MLVAERQEKIVNTVVEKGSIRVAELSKMFGFTEETIRRDLEKLERDGKLMRSHGGAVAIQESQSELPYSERETLYVKEKERIASIALSFVEENDTILLDASSTAWFLAKKLPDIPLTVITNSVRALMELAPKKNINVICTGGNLSQTSLSFVGPLTIQSLGNYHADKAFISCKGLDANWGISDANDMQAMVKKKMLEIADKNYLLIDHSKIGKKATSNVDNLSRIHCVISDDQADKKMLADFEVYSVEIRTP